MSRPRFAVCDRCAGTRVIPRAIGPGAEPCPKCNSPEDPPAVAVVKSAVVEAVTEWARAA